MTLLVLVAILLLETFATHFMQYRQHDLVSQYYFKWSNFLTNNNIRQPWVIIGLTLIIPLAVTYLLLANHQGFFGLVFEFTVTVLVLFWLLGPKSLNQFYKELATESDDTPHSLCKKLIRYAHYGYLGVIIWYVLLGPLAAVMYRMVYQLAVKNDQDESEEVIATHWDTVWHLVDWIPTRITALLLLLTGNFANGAATLKDQALSVDADNRELLEDVGLAAGDIDEAEADALTQTRHSIERGLILLTVLVALISFFQL
ncbi:MAG: hypothetical protein HWE27_10490 [Gammaproteobacteria bacterium]|nr:hypothetical protein [Gammaproteobacteria bacterium]